jgi:hypothetical protein
MESMKRSIKFLCTGPGGPVMTPCWVISELAVMTSNCRFRNDDRHSGARQSREPGIHNHDREYGFRACAKWRIPE